MQEKCLLSSIASPKDIKGLSIEELEALCAQIREKIIETVSKNGGHLASNLGAVELTVALHKVFDCPQDQIVWDVGHQCYTHKILTGRLDRLDTIRQDGGISGYPRRDESIYDSFSCGHSSTSISAALGLLYAKSLKGEPGKVVAVIGDGALSGGLLTRESIILALARRILLLCLMITRCRFLAMLALWLGISRPSGHVMHI